MIKIEESRKNYAVMASSDAAVVFSYGIPTCVRMRQNRSGLQPELAYYNASNTTTRHNSILRDCATGGVPTTPLEVAKYAEHMLNHSQLGSHTHEPDSPIVSGLIRLPHGNRKRQKAIYKALDGIDPQDHPRFTFVRGSGPGYTPEETDALVSLGHETYLRYEPLVVVRGFHVHVSLRVDREDGQNLFQILPNPYWEKYDVERARRDTEEMLLRVLETELGIRRWPEESRLWLERTLAMKGSVQV